MNENELKKHIEEWEQLGFEKGKNSNQAGEYYDEHILPYVKEVFDKGSKCLLKGKKYDGLILTVGGSPEPQILSICAIAGPSTKVGLLYTQAANDSLNRIFEGMGWQHSDVFDRARRIDGSNTSKIYSAIMELYREWEKCTETDEPMKIAVGITGGKKVMASAAAMAGAILGADLYYVDTDDKNKLNKPVPGSEYLRLLDNPYIVFGDLEVRKAEELYRRHDYAGAHRIFQQLEGQVRTPNQVAVYTAYKLLCATYEAWDHLDMSSAKQHLDGLLGILERFSSEIGLVPLHRFKEVFAKQQKALECLEDIFEAQESVSERLDALRMDCGFHFPFMLYHSALRRKEQGKFDMACLIFYRLLEWVGQHRLAMRGIDTSEPNYSSLCIDETTLLDKYNEKRKIIKRGKVLSLPDPIALIDGFLVLAALKDEIIADKQLPRILGQTEIRNQCVYAHGMKTVSPDKLEPFRKTVKEKFEQAQNLANIDANTISEQHEFIVPFP